LDGNGDLAVVRSPLTDCELHRLPDFFYGLETLVFGQQSSSAVHMVDRRWVSLVPHCINVEIPMGSEHEYICCALTTHMPFTDLEKKIPPQLSKFIELDRKIDHRLCTRKFTKNAHWPIEPIELDTSGAYDVDHLFEVLNLHQSHCNAVTNHVGEWHTPHATNMPRRSTFKSFRL
jgi:hypothetical protein